MKNQEGLGLPFKNLRWERVVIAMLFTLAFLLGVTQIYERFWVSRHLGAALAAVPGVEEWSLETVAGEKILRVKLGQVDNLGKTCQLLLKETEKCLGRENWEIQLSDKRTPELENTLRKLQYPLYEALAQGNFTSLEKAIQEEAARSGIDKWDLQINNYQVMLYLQKGSGYLYEIIPRQPDKAPPIVTAGYSG